MEMLSEIACVLVCERKNVKFYDDLENDDFFAGLDLGKATEYMDFIALQARRVLCLQEPIQCLAPH